MNRNTMDFYLVSRLKCHSGHLGSDYFDDTMREVIYIIYRMDKKEHMVNETKRKPRNRVPTGIR